MGFTITSTRPSRLQVRVGRLATTRSTTTGRSSHKTGRSRLMRVVIFTESQPAVTRSQASPGWRCQVALRSVVISWSIFAWSMTLSHSVPK